MEAKQIQAKDVAFGARSAKSRREHTNNVAGYAGFALSCQNSERTAIPDLQGTDCFIALLNY